MTPITQAVISAGGLGTRLRPLTDTMPKPMVPVLGKPLLEWHVEQFKKHGVRELFFTLQYLPDVVKNYFGDGSTWGVHIHYVVESTPLGSAGGIALFHNDLDSRFFHVYGDVFSLVDYSTMTGIYDTRDKPIGMQTVKRSDEYGDADIATLDDRERIVAIHRKAQAGTFSNEKYRMRGVSILEKTICKYISNGPSDLAKDVIPAAVSAGENFYGYECGDYSKGINTLEVLREVEAYLATQ